MKKTITKSVGVLLILLTLLSTLTGCYTPGENNNGQGDGNQGGNQGEYEYYALKALYSYNDVMDALSLVRNRYDVKPTYTVSDMGDDYTVVYQFFVGHCWTQYPIDYETFFTTKSTGFFNTYIFLNSETCALDEYHTKHVSSSIIVYRDDEDYDRIEGYKMSYPCVWLREITKNVVDISDSSLLSYSSLGGREVKNYDIYYNGKFIIEMVSCVELDDAFFDSFFNSLVTTKIN